MDHQSPTSKKSGAARLARLASLPFVLVSIVLPCLAEAVTPDPFVLTREISPTEQFLEGQSTGGEYTFSYPITAPPGRNGIQPDLQLSFSSQSTPLGNLLGYGWSLNLPSIERLNKKGHDKFYLQQKSSQFFLSTLSGELLPLTSTTTVGSFLSSLFGPLLLAQADPAPADVSSLTPSDIATSTATGSSTDTSASPGPIDATSTAPDALQPSAPVSESQTQLAPEVTFDVVD